MAKIVFNNLKFGQSVTAEYMNQDDGELVVNLNDDKNNIAVHFNVRFSRRDVVLNSFVNAQWGGEQRVNGYDFAPLKINMIEFHATPDAVKISQNGKLLCDYTHRVPIEAVVNAVIAPSEGKTLGLKF